MDHSLFEPEDFAADDSYLRYYFKLNDEDIRFWEQWISSHPASLDRIMNANRLIQLLSLQLPEEEVQVQFGKINQALIRLQAEESGTRFKPAIQMPKSITHRSRIIFSRKFYIGGIAAVAILAIVFMIAYQTIFGQKEEVLLTETIGINQEVVKTNQSKQPIQFQLEDGTLITLQPKSRVVYPHQFADTIREVKLDGEAFFQVSGNPHRPFYVYHQNLVTHVLGTSFNVKSFKGQAFIEVSVSTGRVEVYEHKSPANKGDKKQSGGVVLTPNQKVTYQPENSNFQTGLVDVPLPLIPDIVNDSLTIRKKDFLFESALIAEILPLMETKYGIDIVVDNETINSCHFSGDLSSMNLFTKLDILCKSINATYEIKGVTILIRGNGCF